MKSLIRYLFVTIFVSNASFIKANVQDSLLVYLIESDSTLRTELVFENTSSDTIIIPGRFKNFYSEWQSSDGIEIQTYKNGVFFKLAGYENMQNEEYIELSGSKFIFLAPKSKNTFSIKLDNYLSNVSGRLSVILSINLTFMRFDQNQDTQPKRIRMETNCVNVRSVESLKNPDITLQMYYNQIDKFLDENTGTFYQFNYIESFGDSILSYTQKFLNDTSLKRRKQAAYAILRIGSISPNQEIRTKALNAYLEVLDYPEIPMDGLFVFEKKDYNEYSKRLLIKLFTRNASEQDIKMRELYYWNNYSSDSINYDEYRNQVKTSVLHWKEKEPINSYIIYTIGLLDMKDQIYLLEEKVGDKKYNQNALKLALARLGHAEYEKYFVDSIKSILSGEIVFASSLYPSIEKLQYICSYNSIDCIFSLLRSEMQFYSDYTDKNCKKVPVSFLALKPLSQSLLLFPLKPDPDLEPWCETMNNVKVFEYIALAKDWIGRNVGKYQINRNFIVFPR